MAAAIREYSPEYWGISEYPADRSVTFNKVCAKWGIFSNFAHTPITFDGKGFSCVEQMFQCMKFTSHDVIADIMSASGQKIKMKAKHWVKQGKQRPGWASMLVDTLKLCLRLKYEQCAEFREALAASGTHYIVEDQSSFTKKYADAYGCKRVGDKFVGPNLMGRLLMELRAGGTLVIPDVHGRRFWIDAVNAHPGADTIFLGDYLDPYPRENISSESAIENFEEIISYARKHPNCHLLLGNHDLHYLCNFGEACRLDYHNAPLIRKLLIDNFDLFKLVALRKIAGKTVVFSHAPILTGWQQAVGETLNISLLTTRLNRSLSYLKDYLPWLVEEYLGQISKYRGGYDEYGSPVWADVEEVNDNIIPANGYAVFGHTQQEHDPIVTDSWACLDCRRAFLIDASLNITHTPQ